MCLLHERLRAPRHGAKLAGSRRVLCMTILSVSPAAHATLRGEQAPCQHNFCLSCFNKWVQQGKKTCVKCRKELPAAMRNNPRINSLLVKCIRMARNRTPGALARPTPSCARILHRLSSKHAPRNSSSLRSLTFPPF